MSNGTLVQLSANKGLQDQVIYDNPEVSFFRAGFRRIRNFAIEPLSIPTNIGASSSGYVSIQRTGDLLGECYLHLQKANNWAGDEAHDAVEEVSFEIGGQTIDRHDSTWLKIEKELYTKAGKDMNTLLVNAKHAFVPMRFWFTQNPTLFLPLIALQFHDCKMFIKTGLGPSAHVELLCNYVYLDEVERAEFAREQFDMLITTVHSTQATRSTGIDLPFNHPVLSLSWGQPTFDAIGESNHETKFQLRLNHNNRFGRQGLPPLYFRSVVPFERFNKTPTSSIYSYSFALDACSRAQPTGSCNFSRIDDAKLDLHTSDSDMQVKVYAVSWNVLRIYSGMGGLSFAN
jgi:hypothetical protein